MNNASEDLNVRGMSENEKNSSINELMLGFCSKELPAYLEKSLAPSLKRVLSPEDIAQETFLKASQNLSQYEYRGDSQLFGWLVSIARNYAISQLRKSSLLPATSLDEGLVDRLFESGILSPSKLFSLKENREILTKALGSLEPIHQAVVRFRYFENRKFVEIANELGKTPDQIRGLHRTALKQLIESFRLIQQFKSSCILSRG